MEALIVQLPAVPLLILLPLAGGIICFLFPREANRLGLLIGACALPLVVVTGWQFLTQGPYDHDVGGWGAPLGIGLNADGLSLLMLVMSALVGFAIGLYATAYFNVSQAARFWPTWLFLFAALNALFVSGDLFNLYVTLEMVGLAAVALTAMQNDREAVIGATRYLFATLFGSLFYLLGVALLYHGFGTVDIAILSSVVKSSPAAWGALGLMSTGLLLKVALFPLHFWLPPAHASASAPVSALLSALVIKSAFYILLRLWLTVFSDISDVVSSILGALGCAAIIWGSLQALRQQRVKLLVAYSTVAQIGYLFVAFPLAAKSGPSVWTAVAYLAFSHAGAKAAMFLAAGNMLKLYGHDRIAELDGSAQHIPISVGAFAIAGVSIMGLPPSGGFNGKWILLNAAIAQGRWEIAIVVILGGILAAGYVFRVLGHAFMQCTEIPQSVSVKTRMEWAALILSFCAILIAFLAAPFVDLLSVGDPFAKTGAQQ